MEDCLVLVHRTKPREIWYLRACPRTAGEPTENQVKARRRFGELAEKSRGVRYAGRGYGLPPAAELVREMRGERFGRREKKPKWMEILEPYLAEQSQRAAQQG